MKIIQTLILALLLCFNSLAQEVAKPVLTLQPKNPVKGKILAIDYQLPSTYNPSEVKVKVRQLVSGAGFRDTILSLKAANKKWRNSIELKPKTNMIALSFKLDNQVDVNGKVGYLFPVYDGDKPIKGAYADISNFYYSGLREMGAFPDTALAKKYIEQEFQYWPEQKFNFFSTYIKILKSDKDLGMQKAEKEIAQYAKKNKLSEDDYLRLREAWKILKNPKNVASYTDLILKKYPYGRLRQDSLSKQILYSNEFSSSEKLYQQYSEIVNYNKLHHKNNIDEYYKNRYSTVSIGMAHKAMKAEDPVKFSNYINNIDDKITKAIGFDDFSQFLMKKKIHLDSANAFSKHAVSLSEEELLKYKDTTTINKIKALYAKFTANYGRTFAAKGDDKKALSLLHKATTIAGPDLEINEYYAQALAASRTPKEVQDSIRSFIGRGNSTAMMRNLFKDAYVKINGSEKGYEEYLNKIWSNTKDKKKQYWKDKSISEKAPDFSLSTMDGKTVTLSALKGKTIVLDFWATWCIPCIESFPGMQLAMENLKNDTSIVFLFVNTWERGDAKKNVVSFLQQQNGKYDQLPIVFDNGNIVAKSYKASNIPQKFIIDASGNIRFRIMGFDGKSKENTAEEIREMIEVLKEKTNTTK